MTEGNNNRERMIRTAAIVLGFRVEVVCNQSPGTQITMLQCTIAGGRTKGAN